MSALPQAIASSDALRFQAANSQGVKAVQSGNPGAALAHYEEALAIHDDAMVWMNYGDSLARCGRLAESRTAFERSIELNPAYDQAWYNLAVTFEKQSDFVEARRCYLEAAGRRVMPNTMNNLGNIDQWLVRLEEAEVWYRSAIKHGYGDAIWNLSLCLLMQGKYREGWDWYAFRPQMTAMRGRERQWRGENLRGKTLVIVTEQGLGDSIFMLRYIPEMRRQGARLIIACDPGLKRLILAMVAELEPELPPVMVVEKGPTGTIPVEAFDYETLAMSIPGYLSPDGTGPRAAYLKAQGVALPRETLNVGLCWNGSTAVGVPAERNMPLALLAPLAAIAGVRLYSLQKGDGVEEMASCGFVVENAMAGVTDVYDTACVIASLDLVITIDTLIPHLAGALGKPVWLMNRFASCWQWGTTKFEPQLYASVQQFRQSTRGDWSPVVEQVTSALSTLAKGKS